MIELYSKVMLKTGEIGYVIESYNDGEHYEIELPVKEHQLNLRTVSESDIEKVLWYQK